MIDHSMPIRVVAEREAMTRRCESTAAMESMLA
jgi:hypothetical protein